METQIDVAFIIPHKGREELLEKTVQSLIKQDDGEKKLNITIIVVSQNEKAPLDESLSVENRTLKIYTMPQNLTISALRNEGVKKTEANYIAFIDADMYLSPDWVCKMIHELEIDKSRAIVSSYEHIPENATSIEKIRVLLNNQSKDSKVPFMTGRNLFLTRETFNAIGGFPENLITAEDYYFTGKASDLGDLYMSSKSFAIHLGEDKNYKEMFRKEIWRSRSNYISMLGRKVPLSEVPSLLIPLWIAFTYVGLPLSLLFCDYTLLIIATLIGMFFFPVFLYGLRCWKICEGNVSIFNTFKFYSVYFAARGFGVFVGLKDLVFKK